MDKKSIKAAKLEAKKSDVKSETLPKKITMESAVELFNSVKKHISATKKATKQIGKFFTEALKTGDQKYFERVQKLFGRIGYVYTPENDFVTFESNAKVKRQKVKKQKIKEAKKTAVKADESEKAPEETLAEPSDLEDVEFDANEDDDYEDEIDDAMAENEIEGRRDDEDDEEFDARVNEERNMMRERAADATAAREEIYEAMEENGDFS